MARESLCLQVRSRSFPSKPTVKMLTLVRGTCAGEETRSTPPGGASWKVSKKSKKKFSKSHSVYFRASTPVDALPRRQNATAIRKMTWRPVLGMLK